MSEAQSSGEPNAASPANQVSLPRWNELKREYNLRHKSLMRYSAPAADTATSAATSPDDPAS
ncbi:hypothetical protein [Cryobacterium sp. GrIS_2_6]|uniref:hypothetical protein n=1 Tax=Cryobacterium sp. GrIS_2_6 TaxID=3162785 RepID=UPI002E093C10|nr:hypothetical protein [Cryobacterium psychrotolerans]